MTIESRLLEPAVEAARRALRDLEPDQVPAPLRRVAASSARRLPPPQLRKLVAELDNGEWLRDKALEAWPEADPDDADPARAASALFLLRPEGWEERAEALSEERRTEERGAVVGRLRRQIAQLEAEARTARQKSKAAAAAAEAAKVEAARRVEDARAGVEAARRDGGRDAARLRRRVEELEATVAELGHELQAADERLAALKEELLRARRAVSSPTATGPVAWSARDPIEMARLLDEVARSVRPGAVAAAGVEPSTPAPLVLPAGVRPDQAAAIEHLLAVEEPFTMVVDGYNVTFLVEAAAFTEGPARERLNQALARVRRMARAPLRMVVVYDSADAEGAPGAPRPDGVEVRFAPDADEEVVALARTLPERLAVVSSDRSVRERAEEAGALGLWAQALVAWLRRR